MRARARWHLLAITQGKERVLHATICRLLCTRETMKRIASIIALLVLLASTLSTVQAAPSTAKFQTAPAAPAAQGAPISGTYGDPGDLYLTYSISGADFTGYTEGSTYIVGTYTGAPIQFSGDLIVNRSAGFMSYVSMKASLGDQMVQWPAEGEDNKVQGRTVELPFNFTFTVPPDYESSSIIGSAYVQACGGTCGTYAIDVLIQMPEATPTPESWEPTPEPEPSPTPAPEPDYRLRVQSNAPKAPLHFTIHLEKREGTDEDAPYQPVPGAKLKVFAPGYQGNENRLADEFVAPSCTNCQTRQTDLGTLASLSDPVQAILMETDGGGKAEISLFLDFGRLGNRVPQRDAPLEVPIAVEAWVNDGEGGERIVAQTQQSAKLEAIGVVLAISYRDAQKYDVGGSPLPRNQGPLESYYDDPGTRDGPRTLSKADRVLVDWPGRASVGATGSTSGMALTAGDLIHAGDRVMINACDMVTNRIVDGLPAGAPGEIWVKVRFFDGLKAKVGVNGSVCRTPVTFGQSPESSGWLSSGQKFYYWAANGTMNAIIGHFVWPYKIVTTMSSVGKFLAWATGNEGAGWSPVYIKVKSAFVVQFDEDGTMRVLTREGAPELFTEATGEAGLAVPAGNTARVTDGLTVEIAETQPDAAGELDQLLAALYDETDEIDTSASTPEVESVPVPGETGPIDLELPTELLAAGGLLLLALVLGIIALIRVRRRARRRATQPVAAGRAALAPAPAYNPNPSPAGYPAPAGTPAPAQVVWRLLAVEGPNAGQAFPFARQMELGRSADSFVPIQDEQASRRHAMIHQQGQGYLVVDLGSRNGTYVNGTRIAQPTWIGNHDRIRIGGSVFEVQVVKVAASPAGRPTTESPTLAATPVQVTAACPHCGHSLRPGFQFCGTCGAPLAGQPAGSPHPVPAQPPAAVQPAPRRGAGKIVGVVPLVERRKGLMGSEAFNLLLTLEHLIFARVTTEMIRAASEQAKQEAEDQGKGFFKQWGASMGANRKIVEQYFQMPVETILRQHADNFAVPTSQVRKITFSSRNTDTTLPEEMVIHAGNKQKFQLKGTTIGDARKVLRQVLEKRVK